MTQDTRKPSPLYQLWQAMLEVSEVAVAVQYRAPWADPAESVGKIAAERRFREPERSVLAVREHPKRGEPAFAARQG